MKDETKGNGAASGRRQVRAACPHDCPDTGAMRVTVENGIEPAPVDAREGRQAPRRDVLRLPGPVRRRPDRPSEVN